MALPQIRGTDLDFVGFGPERDYLRLSMRPGVWTQAIAKDRRALGTAPHG